MHYFIILNNEFLSVPFSQVVTLFISIFVYNVNDEHFYTLIFPTLHIMILYFGKSEQTFTCTKSTTDTLEKGKNLTLFWCLYCKL